MNNIGRNAPCPCGSGKRYKQCCSQLGSAEPVSIRPTTGEISNAFLAAVEHHQAGRLPQAEAIYQKILQIAPNHADALHHLGLIAHQAGKLDIAVELISQSLAFTPNSAEALSNLGIIFKDQGKLDKAVASYQKAISLKPDFSDAHNNLGAAFQNQGKPVEAVASYRKAISLKPNFAEAHYNLGVVLKEQGKLNEAIICYQKAISARPNYAEAYVNLGVALKSKGKLSEAIVRYQKAISINPHSAEAHFNLGNAFKDQGKLAEAIVSYQQAVTFRPRHAEALLSLGNALKGEGKLAEAVVSYKNAMSINPDYAEAHYGLGNALKDQGLHNEALASLRQAFALKPDFVEARWAIAMSQIPSIFLAHQDTQGVRKNFSKELKELDTWLDTSRVSEGFEVIGYPSAFYLAYQEEDNKHLLSQYGTLCNRLMAHWQSLNHYRCGLASSDGPIKIGIISNHITNHSVWHAIIKGWMLHLDRSQFELHVFYLGAQHDSETALAQSLATTFTQGYSSLSQWAEAILAHQIEVLIYPEIGMHPMTEQLANLRLAPMQLATWGHPETTGLPTIDHYISATDIEPEHADNYYTEKLIKLPNLGCCYQHLDVKAADPDLKSLGIQSNEPLLICPGTPYKYAPQFDCIFVEIARRLGRCQFIFFIPASESDLSARLRERLLFVFKEAGLDFDNFGKFVPWLDRPTFYGLMQHADVYLDTIGFSGFNTAIQAVECGLPIVTRKGHFMRGRLASGILKRMNLSELIVSNEEDYISLAVKLIRDKAYQQTIEERIKESRNLIFDDMKPIRALEDFLVGKCRANS